MSEQDSYSIVSSKQSYLDVLRPHGTHAGDSQDEAYCVEDIGLSAAVETRDGIEALVPATNNCSDCV